jgi:hypothetical protein
MADKDVGKIKKNGFTDIVLRVDDFGGKIGLTIREFTSGDKYTGFTKAGTRIPAESFSEFKKIINSIDEDELLAMKPESKPIEKGAFKKSFVGKSVSSSTSSFKGKKGFDADDVSESDLM